MNTFLDFLGLALVVCGVIFMFLGSIGIVRLPDFFSRVHAASKVDTVGICIVILGVACIEGISLDAVKVLLAALFIMMTNPVSAHALARSALRTGITPWKRGDPVPTHPEDEED